MGAASGPPDAQRAARHAAWRALWQRLLQPLPSPETPNSETPAPASVATPPGTGAKEESCGNSSRPRP